MSELETALAALRVEEDRYKALVVETERLRSENEVMRAKLELLAPVETGNVRAAAITTLMTSTTPSDVATRAFIRDVYTAINDVREALNLSRQTEETILPRVIAGVRGGLGDPIPPEALPSNGG